MRDRSTRVGFLGAGAFGLPTLASLRERFDVPFVLSQPDRPAGRGQKTTPTPISQSVLDHPGPALLREADVNSDEVYQAIVALKPDVLVVIAFGQKIGPRLLGEAFAVNLHASILPRWRGAAPINRAMMAGDTESGVSVISLAHRMDAGAVHTVRRTPIDALETAGELHDRLALLGVEAICEVLERFGEGVVECVEQDEALVLPAPKLSRPEGTVSFDKPAEDVRARVHGLSPWPGCDVMLGDTRLRLRRVRSEAMEDKVEAGVLLEGGRIACASGCIALLEVQPAGKGVMKWEEYQRGSPLKVGTRCKAIEGTS